MWSILSRPTEPLPTKRLCAVVRDVIGRSPREPVEDVAPQAGKKWQSVGRWRRRFLTRGAREFPLTQQFIAMMLGASRPTVTVVASTLQRAGLIAYKRGRLTIIDREALESACCECYRTATDLLTEEHRPQSPTRSRPRMVPMVDRVS